MTHSRLVWLLAGCWIAISLAIFFAIDASSTRSWLYLAAVALGPPVVLLRLWPQVQQPTADDVIHGRGGRS
jgi:hypothetical protein